MRPMRNTDRVLHNAATDRLLAKERTLGDNLKFDAFMEQVAGVKASSCNRSCSALMSLVLP